jgi:uncharacterized protein
MMEPDKVDWHELLSKPEYDINLQKDVSVTMRDGVRLSVDVYHPQGLERSPALLSFSWYGKESQTLPTNPTYQPSDYLRGTGGHEGGEQHYFVPRGYTQVIPDIRGLGKSEGEYSPLTWGQDGYDLIEWIAAQPWCSGNVGMTGMSAFASSQFHIASIRPPHLKAIFPFEGRTDAYRHHFYHGGIFNYYFQLHIWGLMPVRSKPAPASFREFSEDDLNERVKALQNDPDIQCTPYLHLITQCPQMNASVFDLMLHPFDGPFYERQSAYPKFSDITIPAYLGSRWNGWALHLPGAFDAYEGLASSRQQKKLLVVPTDNYGGMDRPFHEVQDVCLRWYDHWLKGVDTGILDEPPIMIFVQGLDKWRYEETWPLEGTEWTKFFLRHKGELSTTQPRTAEEPQTFTSDPWANPTQGFSRADVHASAGHVPKAVYETKALAESVEVTGPLALYWYASIESSAVEAMTWRSASEAIAPVCNDTDWYLKLIDVDAKGSRRCVAEGWLKASHYELDETRSKPYTPYHSHTRSLPIEPGQVIRYAADMRMTSNLFLPGHRVRLEIAGQDQVQALWYHLPHMAKVKHVVYSSGEQPSYLLLPVIPKGHTGAGEPLSPPQGPFRIPKHKEG